MAKIRVHPRSSAPHPKRAIPFHTLSGSLRGIRIQENHEKLVSLSEAARQHRIVLAPQYFRRGIAGAIPESYVREHVAKMLVEASQALPAGLSLVIWDAWRPLAVQQSLFDDFKKIVAQENPHLDEAGLVEKTSIYVAIPSDHPDRPSNHYTGGAVDLSIIKNDGSYLDMGTDFDDFSPKASTAFYEELMQHGSLLPGEEVILHNRRLLYSVMLGAGFVNYPEEWWHFDYGDRIWASMSGSGTAVYGGCTP